MYLAPKDAQYLTSGIVPVLFIGPGDRCSLDARRSRSTGRCRRLFSFSCCSCRCRCCCSCRCRCRVCSCCSDVNAAFLPAASENRSLWPLCIPRRDCRQTSKEKGLYHRPRKPPGVAHFGAAHVGPTPGRSVYTAVLSYQISVILYTWTHVVDDVSRLFGHQISE